MVLEKAKGFGTKYINKIRDWLADVRADIQSGGIWFKLGLLGVGIYVLLAIAVGVYWTSEPDAFDVRENAVRMLQGQDEVSVTTGAVTTTTLIRVVETLVQKPGGFLSNDISPPGVWLDNTPNWEYGVLVQVRDLSKAMREAFSRSQSQSVEDADLAKAESRFIIGHDIWVMPIPENEYREGTEFLRHYLQRITDQNRPDAQFFARADNLRYWLSTVETRLGSMSQRLSASVGQRRINTDLAREEGASQTTRASEEVEVKTPWSEIDDVFYEARGASWALVQFLKAVEVDFADVLQKKNALISLRQIIRELEATQETVYSPMILNGSGFGFLANHSLVMASYISRANAGIIDLRELLSRG